MKHAFFLAAAGTGVGLTTVALGLVNALDRRGVRVAFFKPIAQASEGDAGPERSTLFIRKTTALKPADPIPLAIATKTISEQGMDQLMGSVIAAYGESTASADVVVVEGLLPIGGDSYLGVVNNELMKTLNAQVILVVSAAGKTIDQLDDQIQYAANAFGGLEKILGVIINRYPVEKSEIAKDLIDRVRAENKLFGRRQLELIGVVPDSPELTYCRTVDIQRHLNAEVINAGEMASRRVKKTNLLARTVPNLLHALAPGAILLTPADRSDVILAVGMAALSQIPIAGLILTGDSEPDERIVRFCRPALETGLPLLRVRTNSYDTATQLYQLTTAVPLDDLQRIEDAIDHVAQTLEIDWLISQSKKELDFRLSPAAFLHQLTEKARAAQKRVVLPEGVEPRTVKAAAICARRGIARCVLLGDPAEIQAVARSQDIELPDNLEILNPAEVRPNYVDPLFEMRKHKGLSLEMAASQLEDNVVLGTVMLAVGVVDGLVSGAVHSTANTIRPALQIIKTKPNARAVSSIFFMCLPEQVLVYGDCAVIPDPDAETLADIAIQSADSAAAFGIPPRVAMISYSTGESGSGADVEKVRAATKIAQAKRPDILLDGPLQYDAAFMPDVAKTKAPHSPVAGRATVFIFPDLNTGNTTYKAVQRSANVISIGPMLQGLKRPVNDLSRGALVDDIVYTIALTAVQAAQG
ncbi:MAG TPA: phosphate acetyltransferase [Chthoniobacterales bacterium]|jgi:phosphate acetyltransferase|nr:phosphate acetyltransferase [Chthoniobacterales bacterium]